MKKFLALTPLICALVFVFAGCAKPVSAATSQLWRDHYFRDLNDVPTYRAEYTVGDGTQYIEIKIGNIVRVKNLADDTVAEYTPTTEGTGGTIFWGESFIWEGRQDYTYDDAFFADETTYIDRPVSIYRTATQKDDTGTRFFVYTVDTETWTVLRRIEYEKPSGATYYTARTLFIVTAFTTKIDNFEF